MSTQHVHVLNYNKLVTSLTHSFNNLNDHHRSSLALTLIHLDDTAIFNSQM